MMAIKAIDRDEGRNGYIEYMLESNSSTIPFTLGSVDGLLRVSGRLDRETKANYELTVMARDRGEPPKSTQTKILVKVLDENDNSPVFDPKHYSASVAENASIGASVLQVSLCATLHVELSFISLLSTGLSNRHRRRCQRSRSLLHRERRQQS
jgi:protocadherin Fat 4